MSVSSYDLLVEHEIGSLAGRVDEGAVAGACAGRRAPSGRLGGCESLGGECWMDRRHGELGILIVVDGRLCRLQEASEDLGDSSRSRRPRHARLIEEGMGLGLVGAVRPVVVIMVVIMAVIMAVISRCWWNGCSHERLRCSSQGGVGVHRRGPCGWCGAAC
jgi:hypothetical protein